MYKSNDEVLLLQRFIRTLNFLEKVEIRLIRRLRNERNEKEKEKLTDELELFQKCIEYLHSIIYRSLIKKLQ